MIIKCFVTVGLVARQLNWIVLTDSAFPLPSLFQVRQAASAIKTVTCDLTFVIIVSVSSEYVVRHYVLLVGFMLREIL